MSTAAAVPGIGLVHQALFYLDAEEYVTGVERFLRDGLERAEPAMVAVPNSHLDVLRSALGPDAAGVRFVDMATAGRNPGRIIPALLYAFAREHSAQRVRIVDEPIWPGRTPAEYRAAVQHEALTNVALADQAATIMCTYDRRGLDDAALTDARRTHPVLVEYGVAERSVDYDDPRVVADASCRMLPEPPEWWGDMLVFSSAADLRPVRQFVEGLALRVGLGSERVSDLCFAVNEIATNTLQHTGEPGILSIWQDSDTECLVCEISDSGQLTDRLVGRIPPAVSALHGRGLILVNSLCDLVELPTGRIGSGTTVRLHMRLRP
ncbi:MAG: anti-sigma factor RsbA family regulatory protein [Pseudonocardiaceae bacterium]